MDLQELFDREAIRKVLAAYTMAGDRLRVEEFAAVFTQDGVFESENVAKEKCFRYTGREAIKEFISGWGRETKLTNPSNRANFVRHHLSSCQIDLTGADAAKSRTYWVAFTNLGPDHCGYYLDDFRKVGGEWLIANRKVREDWVAEGSLFAIAGMSLRGRVQQ